MKQVKKESEKSPRVHSVLAITEDAKISALISEMLPPYLFEPIVFLENPQEAKRMMMDLSADIIIVDSGNGQGLDVAEDFSVMASTVIVLAPPFLFDEISSKAERYGIITLSKPPDRFLFYMTMKTACAVQNKIKALTEKTIKLEEKMEEIRIVNRAKLILMQRLNMSEPEAHRYIEKEAMDRCLKKSVIAGNIIRTYDR